MKKQKSEVRHLTYKADEQEKYVLECHGISKAFGGTQALCNVELLVRQGEVHALLGENGAGKSTLMKCIIGLHQQDEGEILFEGKPYSAKGPTEALNAGISMIHQELNPEPHLTIAESIFLKRENTKGILLDKRAQNKRADEILKKFNFPYNSKTLMKELTLAQMQMVEIIKAVSYNSRLIIMDEPTSSLDSEETAHLFSIIRELKEKGVAIIYISHRMEEIFEICDYVSVFRDGTYVGARSMEAADRDELISMMVGRKVENVFPKVECEIGEVVFKVEGLSGKGFDDISFEVRKGEILGISGLVGSGRSETMRAIFGMDPITEGKLYLEGREIKIKKPGQAIKQGICMVNEDRKNFGLALHRSIRENIALPTLPIMQKGMLLNKKKEEKNCLNMGNLLKLKAASIEHDAFSLSGGNQQKTVLAKWLLANPKVLILDEPTRGVDVGAKSEIHNLMCQFAAKGLAVIMISSELPEIMGMSDRILVYHEGKIRGEVLREEILSGEADQEKILAKAFGGM
jgi:ribose transport system ATP-binding protein/inositol transport system ATP-binding protein